jgi:hypothetical protein
MERETLLNALHELRDTALRAGRQHEGLADVASDFDKGIYWISQALYRMQQLELMESELGKTPVDGMRLY